MATLLLGLALPIIVQKRIILMFGIVFAGWAAINIVIALLGKIAPPPKSIPTFVRLLAVNMIANQFYIFFGIGFGFLSDSPDWKGAGWAIAIQGLALLILDGKLLKESRELLESED